MAEAAEAQRARELAERALLAHTEFVANVSHELRTPLQSIIGFADLGARRAREQPVLADLFVTIGHAGERMRRLVDDLLDIARADSAQLTMNFEFVDLRPLLREVALELRPQVESRALTLRLHLPPQPLTVSVDAARMQQVVRNVLANALKFSPDAGEVEVEASVLADGSTRIDCADRGPGVPADELERIFDAFVQSSRTRDGAGGTGLGLAISRRIVAAHGGAIVALAREGGGSVFRITLPGMAWGRSDEGAVDLPLNGGA